MSSERGSKSVRRIGRDRGECVSRALAAEAVPRGPGGRGSRARGPVRGPAVRPWLPRRPAAVRRRAGRSPARAETVALKLETVPMRPETVRPTPDSVRPCEAATGRAQPERGADAPTLRRPVGVCLRAGQPARDDGHRPADAAARLGRQSAGPVRAGRQRQDAPAGRHLPRSPPAGTVAVGAVPHGRVVHELLHRSAPRSHAPRLPPEVPHGAGADRRRHRLPRRQEGRPGRVRPHVQAVAFAGTADRPGGRSAPAAVHADVGGADHPAAVRHGLPAGAARPADAGSDRRPQGRGHGRRVPGRGAEVRRRAVPAQRPRSWKGRCIACGPGRR